MTKAAQPHKKNTPGPVKAVWCPRQYTTQNITPELLADFSKETVGLLLYAWVLNGIKNQNKKAWVVGCTAQNIFKNRFLSHR